MNKPRVATSWQGVSKWYANATKDKGHYYHEHVVIPGVLKLLKLQATDIVLDLACGSGVLGRAIPRSVPYVGVDIAKGLVDDAKAQDNNPKHSYIVGDITKQLPSYPELISATRSLDISTKIQSDRHYFSHITCILALQNVEEFQAVFDNAAKLLKTHGTFVIVLNHPCFRIPRQSGWGIEEQSKLQYRKINRYLSPLKIPITMHPGEGEHAGLTWSFHEPLSVYMTSLFKAGFVVNGFEEWSSDKESEGKFERMENRARNEIPLFLAISAKRM